MANHPNRGREARQARKAAFDDMHRALVKLAAFDEPGAVQTAREVLAKHFLGKGD